MWAKPVRCTEAIRRTVHSCRSGIKCIMSADSCQQRLLGSRVSAVLCDLCVLCGQNISPLPDLPPAGRFGIMHQRITHEDQNSSRRRHRGLPRLLGWGVRLLRLRQVRRHHESRRHFAKGESPPWKGQHPYQSPQGELRDSGHRGWSGRHQVPG